MKLRICITCKKDETEVEFYKTGSYCKYCKSIIEAKRRYKKQIDSIDKNNILEIYKFRRMFLYQSVAFKNRSLDFCSKVMGYPIEEIDKALHDIGYYNKDYGWCSNCAVLKPLSKFRAAINRKKLIKIGVMIVKVHIINYHI